MGRSLRRSWIGLVLILSLGLAYTAMAAGTNGEGRPTSCVGGPPETRILW